MITTAEAHMDEKEDVLRRHIGHDGQCQVQRNDGTAAACEETREMLEIQSDNASSKLSHILREPCSMTKSCSAAATPKPQEKKSTFCGEQYLEEKSHPNLMEQMIVAAGDAKASKYREDQERQKHFGKGLKKGFLTNQTTNSTSKTRRRKKIERGGENNGELIDSIRATKSNTNSLVLEEVQEAMKPTGIPTVEQMLANGDWADESFRKRIMAKPKLVASMATPEFGRIVELMKEDPKKLRILLERNPNMADLYKTLMTVLHEHFQELGEKEEHTVAKELGPLAEKAVLKHQILIKGKSKMSEDEAPQQGDIELAVGEDHLDEAAKNVLAKPNLRALLEDKELQRVLSECSIPAKLRMHMSNTGTREKIMQLADAGLIAIQ